MEWGGGIVRMQDRRGGSFEGRGKWDPEGRGRESPTSDRFLAALGAWTPTPLIGPRVLGGWGLEVVSSPRELRPLLPGRCGDAVPESGWGTFQCLATVWVGSLST